MKDYITCDKPKLKPVSKVRAQKAIANPKIRGYEVTFPVSYRYNGGTIFQGEHYMGYNVPKPDVPKGWHLRSIGVGLQLNCRPPMATMFLERDDFES